ncbi:MAG: aspartate kinase [Myxococcota bacterium]
MATIVQKYGGSSVASVAKLEAVAEKVAATRRSGNDVVVVISAMGKTTDELLGLAHAIDAAPPRRELDMLVSTGERISMALLSMAIQKRGQDAISFTGSQSGIITNDRHYDARIIEVRPHRVEDELARGRVVIVAGYQGMSYKREITTLGRGGTDTTAVAMAAALGASHAEIYSDVDGVYSADPRKVSGAQHLPELSYDEMQAMALAGAKVLHHKAVAYAREARIAIHARSTFGSERETVVHGQGTMRGAIVQDEHVVLVHMKAAQLGAITVAPAQLQLRDGQARFCLSLSNVPDWAKLKGELEAIGATLREDLARVAVVRAGIGAEAARFVDVLGEHCVLLHGESMSLSALVPAASSGESANKLHEAFIGN